MEQSAKKEQGKTLQNEGAKKAMGARLMRHARNHVVSTLDW